MSDLQLLKEYIEKSGMTKVAIAKKSGIKRETLYNRLAGSGEFTVPEIVGLTEALRLSRVERDRIFFAG